MSIVFWLWLWHNPLLGVVLALGSILYTKTPWGKKLLAKTATLILQRERQAELHIRLVEHKEKAALQSAERASVREEELAVAHHREVLHLIERSREIVDAMINDVIESKDYSKFALGREEPKIPSISQYSVAMQNQYNSMAQQANMQSQLNTMQYLQRILGVPR